MNFKIIKNIVNNKVFKLIVSLFLSVIIIYILYRKTDIDTSFLYTANSGYFLLYIILIIIQIIIASYRWQQMVDKLGNYKQNFSDSLQQVIGSYSANLIIPAKMGEVVRIVWMRKLNLKYGIAALVITEKLADIISVSIIAFFALTIVLLTYKIHLFFWLVFLLAFILIACLYIWRKVFIAFVKQRFPKIATKRFFCNLLDIVEDVANKQSIAFISIILWLIQLLQFYYMFAMFDTFVPLTLLLAGAAIAVLAGAVVISIGGIGPRDAALFFVFSFYVRKEIILYVGIMSIFRIVVPALIGIPFFFNQTRKT